MCIYIYKYNTYTKEAHRGLHFLYQSLTLSFGFFACSQEGGGVCVWGFLWLVCFFLVIFEGFGIHLEFLIQHIKTLVVDQRKYLQVNCCPLKQYMKITAK